MNRKNKIKLREFDDKKLLWIAAGIGLLGNLSANFILETSSKETRFGIGLVSFIGFFFLLFGLSKGYGRIYENKK